MIFAPHCYHTGDLLAFTCVISSIWLAESNKEDIACKVCSSRPALVVLPQSVQIKAEQVAEGQGEGSHRTSRVMLAASWTSFLENQTVSSLIPNFCKLAALTPIQRVRHTLIQIIGLAIAVSVKPRAMLSKLLPT